MHVFHSANMDFTMFVKNIMFLILWHTILYNIIFKGKLLILTHFLHNILKRHKMRGLMGTNFFSQAISPSSTKYRKWHFFVNLYFWHNVSFFRVFWFSNFSKIVSPLGLMFLALVIHFRGWFSLEYLSISLTSNFMHMINTVVFPFISNFAICPSFSVFTAHHLRGVSKYQNCIIFSNRLSTFKRLLSYILYCVVCFNIDFLYPNNSRHFFYLSAFFTVSCCFCFHHITATRYTTYENTTLIL